HCYDFEKLDKTAQWLLSTVNSTIKEITELSDAYKLPSITDKIRDLIVNDISRWYIMLIREKIDVYSEHPDKFVIMSLLFEVLYKVILLLAPINPMISEHLYQNMFRTYMDALGLEEKESIHLQDWPEVQEKFIDKNLEKQMEFSRELIEIARSLKNQNRLRLRWPNKKIVIESTEKLPEVEFTETIKKMVNVRDLEIVDSFTPDDNFAEMDSRFGKIYLDLNVNDDILADRVVNDLIRNIQYSRKKNNFKVGEEIELKIGTDADHLKQFIEENSEFISDKVSAGKLDIVDGFVEEVDGKAYEELSICPNENCSATLKQNINHKLYKKGRAKCPYCQTEFTEDKVKKITFYFQRKK
ncbi:MAG: class I tRNA ligase family protein, partial [Candidatus Lokiarchaeota archaeon]|nr:class I tRNA ligase family protein [Candidatus Lokiarchaeota archaeon]